MPGEITLHELEITNATPQAAFFFRCGMLACPEVSSLISRPFPGLKLPFLRLKREARANIFSCFGGGACDGTNPVYEEDEIAASVSFVKHKKDLLTECADIPGILGMTAHSHSIQMKGEAYAKEMAKQFVQGNLRDNPNGAVGFAGLADLAHFNIDVLAPEWNDGIDFRPEVINRGEELYSGYIVRRATRRDDPDGLFMGWGLNQVGLTELATVTSNEVRKDPHTGEDCTAPVECTYWKGFPTIGRVCHWDVMCLKNIPCFAICTEHPKTGDLVYFDLRKVLHRVATRFPTGHYANALYLPTQVLDEWHIFLQNDPKAPTGLLERNGTGMFSEISFSEFPIRGARPNLAIFDSNVCHKAQGEYRDCDGPAPPKDIEYLDEDCLTGPPPPAEEEEKRQAA